MCSVTVCLRNKPFLVRGRKDLNGMSGSGSMKSHCFSMPATSCVSQVPKPTSSPLSSADWIAWSRTFVAEMRNSPSVSKAVFCTHAR